jgi:hypothetical protein
MVKETKILSHLEKAAKECGDSFEDVKSLILKSMSVLKNKEKKKINKKNEQQKKLNLSGLDPNQRRIAIENLNSMISEERKKIIEEEY